MEININDRQSNLLDDVSNEETNDSGMQIFSSSLGFITDIGRRKKYNQDYALVGERNDGMKIMVLADGVTTSKYSAESARFSCEFLMEKLKKKNSFNKIYVEKVIRLLNVEIIKKQKSVNIKNSYLSTVILALIKDDDVIVAWLGDSRAYFIDENQGMQITRDDSYVNTLIDQGEITPEEALNHPKKHVITQCIGIDENSKKNSTLTINVKRYNLPLGKSVLICSDGLWDEIDLTKGIKLSSPLELTLMKIIKNANRAGGGDNITCAIYLPYKEREYE